MQQSKLFCILPDYVCTPDGMEIDQYGNLVLSCPNFADDALSGCVVKIDKAGNVKKWFDVPVLEETGVARNMGIAFDSEYNVYLCDNQGWSERPELLYKGRVLRLKGDDEGNILESRVVAWGMEHPNGIRIRGNYMYVTQSYLHPIHHESGKLVSGVYRFALDEENVKVNNDLSDKNLFATFVRQSLCRQFRRRVDQPHHLPRGRLPAGKQGDCEGFFAAREHGRHDLRRKRKPVHCGLQRERHRHDDAGRHDPPDSDGLHGELNQPGEPIVWDGRIIASCFDLVTGPGKVNTGHSMPATLAQLELER